MVEWGKRVLTTSIVVPTLYLVIEYAFACFTISLWFSIIAQIEFYGLMFKILRVIAVGDEIKKLLTMLENSYQTFFPTCFIMIASWWVKRDKDTSVGFIYIGMFISITMRMLQYVKNSKKINQSLSTLSPELRQVELQKTYAFTFLVAVCDIVFLQFYSIPFIYSAELYKFKNGYSFVLFWLMNCFASDAGGLIIGNKFGKNPKAAKFCEPISPAKTWIGVFGSILGSQVYAIGNYALGQLGGFRWVPNVSFAETVTMSLVSSIICVLGDLFESLIKRGAAEKDSGRFFPGHGGMLDRLDSLLFSSPLFYFYVLKFIAPNLPLGE